MLKNFGIQRYFFRQGIQKNEKNSQELEIVISSYWVLFGKYSALEHLQVYLSKFEHLHAALKDFYASRIPESINEVIRESSCKSAIKFNDRLTLKQSQDILHDLQLTDVPTSCIHGRNTIRPIVVEKTPQDDSTFLLDELRSDHKHSLKLDFEGKVSESKCLNN